MGGSKRGSAGLESLAGEGVGEEEFLAKFVVQQLKWDDLEV